MWCCSSASRALLAAAALAAAAGLAGCGSAPKRPGGFYQDDGPPERPAADVARAADAVPRVEPFHPYANRPYSALGRTYTPIADDRPYRQRGLASWYGRQFHGNRTASGERYDMYAMSAAHPTLPIPSYARVTHRGSGASVIVRVNDRGPFKRDRIIDLSYAAAARLGIVGSGTGEVEVLRLTHADIRAGRVPAGAAADAAPPVDAVRDGVELRAAGALPAAASPPAGAANWSVQLGAFGVAANADALRERVALLLAQSDATLAAEAAPRVERDGALFRVLAGRNADRGAAARLAERIERALDRETTLLRR